jgi:cytochrome c-type biogenesis protein CcmH/NrfG
LWLLAAVSSVVLGQGVISGVSGVILAVGKLLLVFRLEDDFAWERRRILLRLDRGLSLGADFLARGVHYAKRRMWALAAIHLRRGIGTLPGRVDGYTALATAYIRLKHYDRAARTLAEASRINPGAPRVEELKRVLDSLRSGASTL